VAGLSTLGRGGIPPTPPFRRALASTAKIFCGDYHMYHYSTPFTDNATTAKMQTNTMEEISSKLGQNLKRIRTRKKMSQGDIARALDVHRAYISGIENGKRNPTLATIQKLADALGVSADELLK